MGSDEKKKLRTLLNYWIQHNQEHGQEFKEWASKANAFGETEAGEELLFASQEIDRANESLSRALKRLEEKRR